MIGNVVALVGVIFGFLSQGPHSLRAEYDRDVSRGPARRAPAPRISDENLVNLPAPVRRYLRVAGVVGNPRVRDFRVRMHGRIRNGPDGSWMALSAEQYNFVDPPARLFYMNASMFTIPLQGYHRYMGASSTMTVNAAALVPVVDVSGDEMTQGETVTMFNDMCVMAPGSLVNAAIVWETVDARTARALFTNAGRTIKAELSFSDAGELVDFSSDDRYQAAADGKSVKRVRWSTSLNAYRSFGPYRLASRGSARWHEPEGDYAYIEITIDDIHYNVGSR